MRECGQRTTLWPALPFVPVMPEPPDKPTLLHVLWDFAVGVFGGYVLYELGRVLYVMYWLGGNPD